jgi:hypothetical protein
MARRQRSPVVARCKPWPFPRKAGERRRSICQWTCAREPQGAEFVNRRDGRVAVLHPSTKRKGWQVSLFDERGAISDIIRADCNTALYDAGITPTSWKLRTAVPLAGAKRKRR